MPDKTVLVEKTGCCIAVVTLARVSFDNEINQQMAIELCDLCEQLDHDDDIRAVVITGMGDVFCGGTDAVSFQGTRNLSKFFYSLKVAHSVASIEKPVVAALNGDAIDQGLELALACDIRIASNRAKFGLTQVNDGLIPWDGGTQRLPRLVGMSNALDMILTARLIDSTEALEIGLVNETVEMEKVLQKCNEIAAVIARNGPIATRYIKEAVLDGQDMAIGQGLRLEADLNILLQSTDDRAEGIRSFLERRTPKYRGE